MEIAIKGEIVSASTKILVTANDYILINVAWFKSQGKIFKHKVPCRGYNLKSILNFLKALAYVESFDYNIVDEKTFNKHWYGK